jgi:hypothetical protein
MLIFFLIQCYCRGCKVKMTLWGDLAHFVNETIIGKPMTIVVTSTMVNNPQYKGKFIIIR